MRIPRPGEGVTTKGGGVQAFKVHVSRETDTFGHFRRNSPIRWYSTKNKQHQIQSKQGSPEMDQQLLTGVGTSTTQQQVRHQHAGFIIVSVHVVAISVETPMNLPQAKQ